VGFPMPHAGDRRAVGLELLCGGAESPRTSVAMLDRLSRAMASEDLH